MRRLDLGRARIPYLIYVTITFIYGSRDSGEAEIVIRKHAACPKAKSYLRSQDRYRRRNVQYSLQRLGRRERDEGLREEEAIHAFLISQTVLHKVVSIRLGTTFC